VSEGREQRPAGDTAEQQREHDHREVRADFVYLFRDDRAAVAAGQMRGQAFVVAGREPVARVLAETRHRPLTFTGCRGIRDMRLQPRLAEGFTCAVRERGHAVGGETHERGDLVRVHPLDLGVPEHRLPAFGKGTEGAGREGAIESPGGRVIRNPLVLEVVDHVHLDVA
jgi:hypothetical protein